MVASKARRARGAMDDDDDDTRRRLGASAPSTAPSTSSRARVELDVGTLSLAHAADELKYELERALDTIRARDRRIRELEKRVDARERELRDVLAVRDETAARAREREATAAVERDVVLASVNARARAAADERDEIYAHYCAMRRALEACEGELEELRRFKMECERDRRDNAAVRAFADAHILRRALVKWTTFVSFKIKLCDFVRATRERHQRNVLVRAFAAWRARATTRRFVLAAQRRVDERALQRILVHWSLAVEMSRTGEVALMRRVLLRWRDAVDAAKCDAESRDQMFTHFAERATLTFARARRRRAVANVFHAWLVATSHARRAKVVALELLANERRDESVARLKAQQRKTRRVLE